QYRADPDPAGRPDEDLAGGPRPRHRSAGDESAPDKPALTEEVYPMPIADNDVRWIKPPTIGLLEQLYLPAILQGIGTTVKHMTRTVLGHDITQQYPEVEPKLPANYRGVHRLNRDEQGRVKCVACYMCSTACPAHCIDIVAAASPWPDREKYPETFVIDELRCIYCGMCEQACPCDAIELTSVFELT